MVYSIVVTYNGAEWIKKCLSSLVNSKVELHRILVIDNGSQDETVNIIQRNFPVVELIMPGENLGFGKANNLGIAKALSQNADFIFLLNQDAWINDDTFPEILKCIKQHSDYGIISPLQLAADGTFDSQFKNYYSSCNSVVNNKITDVGFVNASGWFMTANCIKAVGGFSPLFFHYGEDADYCNRIKYHGYKIGVATKCSYIHDRGRREVKDIPLKKQEQQRYIANLVGMANIRRPLFLNIFVNLILLIQSILKCNKKDRHLSRKIVIPAFTRSLKMYRKVQNMRKLAKQPGAFLN